MRRDREWWNNLTREERSELVYIERNINRGGRSAYLPDDCSECGICGSPTLGWGPCMNCLNEYDKLLKKANKKQSHKEEET